MSEKWVLSNRNPEKSSHSYTFCIPGSAEKEVHSARTSVLCHIEAVTPRPRPSPLLPPSWVYVVVFFCFVTGVGLSVCYGLFALPHGVIIRLCSVIVVLPETLLYIILRGKRTE